MQPDPLVDNRTQTIHPIVDGGASPAAVGPPTQPIGVGRFEVRVEPQIYDATAGVCVTPPRTPAAVVFVATSRTAGLTGLRTFETWFPTRFGSEAEARAALRRAEGIDEWSGKDDVLAAGFARVLDSAEVVQETAKGKKTGAAVSAVDDEDGGEEPKKAKPKKAAAKKAPAKAATPRKRRSA